MCAAGESRTVVSTISMTLNTHIAEVLQVPHKVALGVDNLIDRFLAFLLRIIDAVQNLLRHGLDPQCACLLSVSLCTTPAADERTLTSCKLSSLILRVRPGCGFIFSRFICSSLLGQLIE